MNQRKPNFLRKRIEKELSSKDDFTLEGKTYFKDGETIYWLPVKDYLWRKQHWKKDLFIGAYEFKEYNSQVKIELVYQSSFCQCFKITDPLGEIPEGDIMLRKSVGDLTEEDIENLNEWNTAYERTSWLTDLALRIRDWLRGD